MTRFLAILAGLIATAIITVLAIIAGAYYYLSPSLPSAETLREVELQTPLRVFSRDGRLMAQIGEKRRTPVRYEDIPPVVISAFLAAEDDRFFEHPGFDYQGITRAAINLMMTGSRSQGGSTITQQLARVYFLTRERSFIRKAKELILAVQIENEFSKEEILSLYLNKIFLGQRSYGVGAAAEVYFGKSLQELTVGEAATIAGLPKAPSTLNPVSNVDRATERRAYVLRRMFELGFIGEREYEDALSLPVESHLYGPKVELESPYATEMVRAEMVRRFGLDAYTAGYKVITTIDARLQNAAQKALRTALLEYDRRHGFRGPVAGGVLDELISETNRQLREDAMAASGLTEDSDEPLDIQVDGLIASPADLPDMAIAKMLSVYPSREDLYISVVLATGEDNSADIYIRGIGRVTVPWDNIKWRRYINDDIIGGAPEGIDEMLAAGDLVYMLYVADKGWQLAQMPQVQGAFVALDPFDGATVALTGGFDFYASKFNRAVQTRRQPGSSFKPFIYSAALENGFTTATLVNDAPVVFDDAALETAWRPENYSRKFHGPTRLREALVKSLNLVSVRILRGTGLGPAIGHIAPFGLPDSALPRDLSLALGSGGVSPWDIAAGYATFASGGHRVDHYLVERVLDADNQILLETNPKIVCSDCEPHWLDGVGPQQDTDDIPVEPANDDALRFDEPNAVEGFTDTATVVFNEVPRYQSFDEMVQHGLQWRPTAAEAPHFVANLDNQARRVITAENAYLVYDMMRDVIQRGTGRRARALGRSDIAGKTGTSNDRRDAWFSGFNGDIVATAWVGFDQDRSLGAGEEGGRTALPIWKNFMAAALDGTKDATLTRPSGIITARIVPESGLVAPAGYEGAIFELFRDGHVPEMDEGETGSEFFPGEFATADDEEDIF
ncbi:MAG: penicillin-binding protein 1A [Gammaproteobacteria bacterium]|nr:penicillin-binding protein 1A [Gammaproteobacteria bacterium]MBT8444007.1 penicillin-binding protein 1A [Gammaproteobacteria bacterium]